MNAIEKINAEMQKNADDLYTEIIGTYIIDRCGDGQVKAKVEGKDKSLKGAMDAVMAVAKKRKHGSCAVLTPAEVFGAVDTYFRIGTDTQAQEKALALVLGYGAPVATPAKKTEQVSFMLEDFI